MSSFYKRFQETKIWIEKVKAHAKKFGFVTTIVGRRRYLDEINSNDSNKRAQAERQAVNSIIQGSAADLIKLAMLKICSSLSNWHKDNKSDSSFIAPRLLLQIHDELLFEVSNSTNVINRMKETVIRCCGDECYQDLKLKVPLNLNCSIGDTWGTMTTLE